MPFRSYKRRRFGYAPRSRFGMRRFGRRRVVRRRRTVKKRLVGMSSRAAVRPSAPNALCRDLGSVYPSCMVLRCKQRGLFSLGGATMALTDGTIATDKCYFRTFPIFPGTSGGFTSSMTAFTGGTAINLMPYGLGRIWNTAGTTGVYQRCCVLKATTRFVIRMHRAARAEASLLSCGGDWMHFLHTRDADAQALPVPLTQALADTNFAQPDVITKIRGGVRTNSYFQITAVGEVPMPSTGKTVVWRKQMWPHKEADQSFEAYVSNEASFGVPGTQPTQRCHVELAGFGNSRDGGLHVEDYGVIEAFVEYTLLLKDPWATVI